MTGSIMPYVYFSGDCQAAMAFYQEALAADIQNVLTYGAIAEQGAPVEWLADETKDLVAHAELTIGGTKLSFEDQLDEAILPGTKVALLFELTEESKFDDVHTRLAEEGQIKHAIEQTFWAKKFSIVEDKFGLVWMLYLTLEE